MTVFFFRQQQKEGRKAQHRLYWQGLKCSSECRQNRNEGGNKGSGHKKIS